MVALGREAGLASFSWAREREGRVSVCWGCTTRPVRGSGALGEVGSEPRPLTPALLRLKHTKEELLSGVCPGAQAHRTGQWLHLPHSRSCET